MNAKTILVALSVLAIALAGCSDDPPSGDLSNVRSGLMVDGEITLEYQEAENPYATGQPIDDVVGCNPDPLAQAAGQPTCQPAMSTISAHIMSIPAPSADGYTLVYVNATGEEREIGALADEGGMYNLNATFEEDLSSFESVAIRMGAVTIATAANTAGTQTFTVNDTLTMASVSGSWSGKKLDLEIAGLPAIPGGATFNGWLVSVDADTGEKTHTEQFPIEGDGPVSFTATSSISEYDEFHIHIGTSSVNLVIADL